MLVKKLELINFMSHKHTEIELNPRINVLVGQKGSGKTAIIEAIRLGFGGLGRERHQRISDFVKEGENEAIIRIWLNNEFQTPDGKYIKLINNLSPNSQVLIERLIKKNGTSQYKLNGKNVTKNEIINLMAKANISADNNLFFLPQERVNEWVNLSSKERLDLLLSALGLYPIKERIERAKQSLIEKEKERKKILLSLDEWVKKLEEEERNFLPKEIAKDRIFYYFVLKLAYLSKRKIDLLNKINDLKSQKKAYEERYKEIESFMKTFDSKMEIIDQRISDIRKELDNLIGKERPQYEYQLKEYEEKIANLQTKILELDEKYKNVLSDLDYIREKWGTVNIDELNSLIESKKSRIRELDQEIMNNEYMMEIFSREEEIKNLREERDRIKREIDRSRQFLNEIFNALDPLGIVSSVYNEIVYSDLNRDIIGPIAFEIKVNLPGRLIEEYIYAVENGIGYDILSSFVALNKRALTKFLRITKRKKYSNKLNIYSLDASNKIGLVSTNAPEIATELIEIAKRKREALKKRAQERLGDLYGAIAFWLCDIIDGRPEAKAIIESYNWDVPVTVDLESAMIVLKELGLRKVVTIDGEVIERDRDPIMGISIFRISPHPREFHDSVLFKLAGFDMEKYREHEEQLFEEMRVIELEIRRISDEIKELRENLPERIKALNKEKNELETQIVEILQDISKIRIIQEKLSELPEERRKTIRMIEELREKIDFVQNELNRLDKDIIQLKKNEEDLMKERENLVKKHSKSLLEFETLEREISLIPVKIKEYERVLEELEPEIDRLKIEIDRFLKFLQKMGEIPPDINIDDIIEDKIIKPAESLIRNEDLDLIRRNLVLEEKKIEDYRKIVIDAEHHMENIELLRKKVNDVREEIKQIEQEMDKIRKFHDEELKELLTEVRRRLKRINKVYKRVLSILGYTGSVSLKQNKDGELVLEVTVDINRPIPTPLEKGGFSSGEKTIAIMALIISILKAFPSPIFLFDEFDVFLDDKSLIDVMRLIKVVLKGFQGIITTTHREEIINEADKVFFLKYDKEKSSSIVLDLKIESYIRSRGI